MRVLRKCFSSRIPQTPSPPPSFVFAASTRCYDDPRPEVNVVNNKTTQAPEPTKAYNDEVLYPTDWVVIVPRPKQRRKSHRVARWTSRWELEVRGTAPGRTVGDLKKTPAAFLALQRSSEVYIIEQKGAELEQMPKGLLIVPVSQCALLKFFMSLVLKLWNASFGWFWVWVFSHTTHPSDSFPRVSGCSKTRGCRACHVALPIAALRCFRNSFEEMRKQHLNNERLQSSFSNPFQP